MAEMIDKKHDITGISPLNSEVNSCFEKLKQHHLAIEMEKKETLKNNNDMESVEDFLMDCIKKLSSVEYMLYSDLFVCVIKFYNVLTEKKDWELLFSLLYTHYFKFRIANCVIYRNGKYHCDFMQAFDLTLMEKKHCDKTISNIRVDCFRRVKRIKAILNEVLGDLNSDYCSFKLADEDKHKFLSISTQLRTFFKSFDRDHSRLTNLQAAIKPDVKLEILETKKQSFTDVEAYKEYLSKEKSKALLRFTQLERVKVEEKEAKCEIVAKDHLSAAAVPDEPEVIPSVSKKKSKVLLRMLVCHMAKTTQTQKTRRERACAIVDDSDSDFSDSNLVEVVVSKPTTVWGRSMKSPSPSFADQGRYEERLEELRSRFGGTEDAMSDHSSCKDSDSEEDIISNLSKSGEQQEAWKQSWGSLCIGSAAREARLAEEKTQLSLRASLLRNTDPERIKAEQALRDRLSSARSKNSLSSGDESSVDIDDTSGDTGAKAETGGGDTSGGKGASSNNFDDGGAGGYDDDMNHMFSSDDEGRTDGVEKHPIHGLDALMKAINTHKDVKEVGDEQDEGNASLESNRKPRRSSRVISAEEKKEEKQEQELINQLLAEEEEEEEEEVEVEVAKKSARKLHSTSRKASVASVDVEAKVDRRAISKILREALESKYSGDNISLPVPDGFGKYSGGAGSHFFRKKPVKNYRKLDWEDIQSHIFPDPNIKICAYLYDIRGMYSSEQLHQCYLRTGYINLCLTKEIGAHSEREARLIDRINDMNESRRDELMTEDPDKIPTVKIIGSSVETIYNTKHTAHDHLRRSIHHDFQTEEDPVAQYYISTSDIIKCCGIMHPRSHFVNSKGNWGLEHLAKLKDCPDQQPHTDGAVDEQRRVIRSYAEAVESAENYKIFDSRKDLGVNGFTNTSGHGDCLMRSDGTPIPLPDMTTTFVGAWVVHFGSGHYYQEPTFKQFTYGDAADKDRFGSAEQFKVFLLTRHEVIIRTAIHPHPEVYHRPLIFYHCTLCGKKDYFTDPYCAHCLLEKKDLMLCCKGKLEDDGYSLGIQYVGTDSLLKNQILDIKIQAEIMTQESYHNRFHQCFRSFGVFGATRLPSFPVEGADSDGGETNGAEDDSQGAGREGENDNLSEMETGDKSDEGFAYIADAEKEKEKGGKIDNVENKTDDESETDDNDDQIPHYLVSINRRSVLSALKTSRRRRVYNVELINFLAGQGGPVLRATRQIEPNEELVLRARKDNLIKDLIMDRDVMCFETATIIMRTKAKRDAKGDLQEGKRKR